MSHQGGDQTGRLVGSYDWPYTRIRRRGIAGYHNLKMRKFFRGAAVYLAIFFVFALAYVWTRVQVIETGYRIRHQEVTRDKLKERNRSLVVEAATLRSPQRLEERAAHLGLNRPNEKRVYFLRR